ncbi:MAG: hypothetical protein MUC48_03445 [Leptolyngbya sp. Prado105]|nr:hypothetical protein [Leptolyngbya sp. Prado105]
MSSHYMLPVSGSIQAKSVNSLYGDPDLLIKEYFLASPEQRAKLRSSIAQRLSSAKSILSILGWTHLTTVKDVYDGAVDLLAECEDVRVFANACDCLLDLTHSSSRDSNLYRPEVYERSWDILIKGIGCAYHIQPQARLRLLQKLAMSLLPILNRRSIKATLLDVLAILFDQEGVNQHFIETYIQFFEQDRDEYIRNYAKETLAELS